MRYICQICGYVYDDEKEKVPFEELPNDWKCPLCGALKSDFKKEEAVKEIRKEKEPDKDELVQLSIGEMSALCSNLARGCEKQYKNEEAKLFRELASYFDKISSKVDNPKIEELTKMIDSDIEEYPNMKEFCLDNEDRGAARVSVWGEKVTRILSSLLNRYQQDGEKMLENTNIWVCSVCGFVYIGDNPPELCPVCKVPSWKFDKVEGNA